MADDGPDSKNQKKSAKHDSGAADLERVTDYAEEKEISSDITGAVATIGERRRKEAQEKMEREIELAKVPIRKDDVELIGPLDTAGVAEAVLQWLTDNKIHHTVFARTVLGWNTAFTPLLRKPVAWAEADVRTRKAYQAMHGWMQRPHQERLNTVREKQEQMNRKRRTESTQKDRRRAPLLPGARPAPLGGDPMAGFGGEMPRPRRALVDIFRVTERPSPSMRQLIATSLDLPARTISNFFSAARTRGIRKLVGPESHGKENLVDGLP
ncbi:homeobox protein cut-like 1 [Pollicipes pollicipes]|uniref:homeobox protein cut-like 1 n=1 Tax=Pollicipes pollicipes TaxID=41117 RepID=UPI0018853592|nr:homeobox protein cut-like 1 [Pollicipes pollicipes]